MKIRDIINYLEHRFPRNNAEDFDKMRIGFNIGSLEKKVTNVMLSLDLTEEVLQDAIDNNCNLIITHHPFIWEPFYKFIFEDYKTQIIKKLLEKEISVYSMHTNLDVADGGVNDTLAEMLGISDIKSYPINTESNKGVFLRYGKINPIKFDDFIENVKMIFNLSGVRYIGNLDTTIESIGIIGGAGGGINEINDALNLKLDCYITGELRLNCAQYAYAKGLNMIEVNHGIEKFVFQSLIEELINEFNEKMSGCFFITKFDTDPLKTK